MVIYRVEHEKDSRGPYSSGIVDYRHYDNETCPSPEEDGIDCAWAYHYGFKSKKDLVNWFGKDYLREFRNSNHYVYKYRVAPEDVAVGGKHVGFDIDCATRLGKVPVYKLH